MEDTDNVFYKNYIRLIHPNTKDFIGEYYPNSNILIVKRRNVTAIINISKLVEDWEQYNAKKTLTND